MKHLATLLIFLISATLGTTQNIIENGGFELYTSAPIEMGQISSVNYWDTPKTGSQNGDYFHRLSTTLEASTPYNKYGFEYGSAYAGIILYKDNSLNYRSFITGTFKEPLEKDSTYTLALDISLAESSGYATQLQIKMYTYDVDAVENLEAVNSPNFVFIDASIIFDTVFSRYTVSFVADSNYADFVIGNFIHDSLAQIHNLGSQNEYSYYYIDNVCLLASTGNICDIPTSTIDYEPAKQYSIYPSFVSKGTTINLKGYSHVSRVDLVDVTGKVVHTGEREVNVPYNASGGEHYVIVHSRHGQDTYKIIIY